MEDSCLDLVLENSDSLKALHNLNKSIINDQINFAL